MHLVKSAVMLMSTVKERYLLLAFIAFVLIGLQQIYVQTDGSKVTCRGRRVNNR
jgi:hypothetical protein